MRLSDKTKAMSNTENNNNQTTGQSDTAKMRRHRMQMIGIMMIGFVTLGASYAVFYFAKTGGGWGTTNHGEFVTPHTTTQQLSPTRHMARSQTGALEMA